MSGCSRLFDGPRIFEKAPARRRGEAVIFCSPSSLLLAASSQTNPEPQLVSSSSTPTVAPPFLIVVRGMAVA
jgi:hypothetical protein